MSVKYEILKGLVKAANIKKCWVGMSTEELLENRRKQNAKNRIPNLRDDAFLISRIEVMGCPVLKLIHKENTDRADLFLIGGGMISAPRPGSIKKALRFARETGLDVFVPYYPLCTDWPLTRAYEIIHETRLKPIINVLPNYQSVYNELEKLILKPERIPELKKQSIEYIRKHHDYIKVAKEYIKFYQNVLENKI